MEYRKLRENGIGLQEGVDSAKAMPVISTMHSEVVDEIASLLKAHMWNLSNLSLRGLRVFSSEDAYAPDRKINIEELPEVLTSINTLGLKEVFNANLDIRILNMAFVNKVKNYLSQGLAITDEKGCFVSSLFGSEEMFRKTVTAPVAPSSNEFVTSSQVGIEQSASSASNNQNPADEMSSEEIALYMDIRQKLQEICSAHPTVNVNYLANNILANIITRIKSREYQFIGVRSMIENCMYDGLDVTPEMEYDGEQFILASFPEEMSRRAG